MPCLFLMSVLLLPRVTFNCILCKVWDASLFTSASSPCPPAPRWCVLSYFLSALARSRLQDPKGEHTANWQCLPSTLALGLFIYAFIYIPCGGYEFQAITVGCKKKSHISLFLQIEFKGCRASTCWVGRKFSSCFENPSLSPSWGLKQPPGSYQVQNWVRVL